MCTGLALPVQPALWAPDRCSHHAGGVPSPQGKAGTTARRSCPGWGDSWGAEGVQGGCVDWLVVGSVHSAVSCLLCFSGTPSPYPSPTPPLLCHWFGCGQCQHTALTVGSAHILYVCPARQFWSLSLACLSLPHLCVVSSPAGIPGWESPEHLPAQGLPLWSPPASVLIWHCSRIFPTQVWGDCTCPWESQGSSAVSWQGA